MAAERVYHLELRQFPHVARAFNLTAEEVQAQFVAPWVGGAMIEHEERRWAPERCRLRILEGPSLRPDELGMGRGWATASRTCADVTESLLARARRGAGERPELEVLKAAIEEVAAKEIGFQDVMALAGAGQPGRRASEQLALAEQAVWEMLHQERLAMVCRGEPVPRERWQDTVLSWATWAGVGDDPVRLRVAAPPSPPGAK
ncbi:MAG: hypothetical protein ACRDNJ_09115 [Solirubrobacteraceae bacterium]